MTQYSLFVAKCFLILGVMSMLGFYLAIRPFRFISQLTPASLGMPYDKIVFETSDHLKLTGWFIPARESNRKTIILLHGYPADKGNILPFMRFLHLHYNLFLFDFRYFGESEGYYTTIGRDEVNDLLAAITYLKKRQINEVGVWGFSMGGAVAIMAAPSIPEIKAVVAESSYARLDWMATDYFKIPILKYFLKEVARHFGILMLGYDIHDVTPATSLKIITVPVLLIQSKNDNVISARHALLLEESSIGHTNIKIINSEITEHGTVMPNHDKVIMQFFNENL